MTERLALSKSDVLKTKNITITSCVFLNNKSARDELAKEKEILTNPRRNCFIAYGNYVLFF